MTILQAQIRIFQTTAEHYSAIGMTSNDSGEMWVKSGMAQLYREKFNQHKIKGC